MAWLCLGCYNGHMQILRRELKSPKALVFLDFEATAYTAEMIEFGAAIALLNKNDSYVPLPGTFKRYVTAKHEIGRVVKKLTGIDEELLQKEGRPFGEVLADFRKYVGRYWEDARFVLFGDYDIRILQKTAELHKDCEISYIRQIQRNHYDFQLFIGRYIQDQNGNPLSLEHDLEVFSLDFKGHEHDAADDARNLMLLLLAVEEHPEILKARYPNVLRNLASKKIGKPVACLIEKLSSGKDVSAKEWQNWLEDYFS